MLPLKPDGEPMPQPTPDILRCTLRFLPILRALERGPGARLRGRRGGFRACDDRRRLAVGEGTWYPALHRLEERGWVEAELGACRRTTGRRSSTRSPKGTGAAERWRRRTGGGTPRPCSRRWTRRSGRGGGDGDTMGAVPPAVRAGPGADVEDDISFHLEMRVRELVERGESPSARARAGAAAVRRPRGLTHGVRGNRRGRRRRRMWSELIAERARTSATQCGCFVARRASPRGGADARPRHRCQCGGVLEVLPVPAPAVAGARPRPRRHHDDARPRWAPARIAVPPGTIRRSRARIDRGRAARSWKANGPTAQEAIVRSAKQARIAALTSGRTRQPSGADGSGSAARTRPAARASRIVARIARRARTGAPIGGCVRPRPTSSAVCDTPTPRRGVRDPATGRLDETQLRSVAASAARGVRVERKERQRGRRRRRAGPSARGRPSTGTGFGPPREVGEEQRQPALVDPAGRRPSRRPAPRRTARRARRGSRCSRPRRRRRRRGRASAASRRRRRRGPRRRAAGRGRSGRSARGCRWPP